jgi:uncharacterized membrane protein
LIAYVTVFLNIPIARQTLGFLYLSFVPGYVIIRLLDIDALDITETVLFSVGCSISFLMLVGLLLNEFGPLVGLSQPLSVISLMITFNGFIILGAIFVCLKSKNNTFSGLEIRLLPKVLLLSVLPVLSVLGVMLVNVYENNFVLLVLFLMIPSLFVIGVISRKSLPPQLYPLAVFAVAIALLLSSSLISRYVVAFGSDIHLEDYVFKTTQGNAYWNSTQLFFGDERFQRLNAMLGITILPTAYSNVLNMDSDTMLKMLFPVIFSLVPLGLYQVWQAQVGKKYAFVATFLFMAEATFYTELLGLVRQMIAELFLVLLLLVMFNSKIRKSGKTLLFALFSFAIIVSHYAVAEIFLFFITTALILLIVLKKPRKNISIAMVLLVFVLMFFWYIYTSNSSTYDSFVGYANFVFVQQSEFLNPASRGQTVLVGLGLATAPSIWNSVSRLFAYATEALVVVGFLGLLTKRIKMQIKNEYLILSLIAVVFLGAVVLMPGLANTLNMTRFYHILLFFAAPVGIMGGEVLVKLVSKRPKEIWIFALLLAILVPYFLFQSGFVYEAAGTDNWSLALSIYRMDPYRLHRHTGYVYPEDVYGAHWMSQNANLGDAHIYADTSSQYNILISYGMVLPGKIEILSNDTRISAHGIVYLNWLNVAKGTVAGNRDAWNTTDLSDMLGGTNLIYSNGANNIYESSSP